MLLRVYHVYNLYQLKLLTSYLSLDSSLIVRNESAITQVSVCVCVCVCVCGVCGSSHVSTSRKCGGFLDL